MKPLNNEHPETVDSTLLALAGRKTIFTVPDSYFDTLESRIMQAISRNESDLELTGQLAESAEESDLPQLKAGITAHSYFTDLESRIRERISEQEFELPVLLGNGDHPFTVPDKYFENLSSVINARISESNHAEEKPLEHSADQLPPAEQAMVIRFSSWAKIRMLPLSRIAAAASIAAVLVFTGIRIRSTLNRNSEIARTSSEEHFNQRYDIDEGLIEDELVDQDSAIVPAAVHSGEATDGPAGDKYLLEHADVNTLIEEI